MALVLRAAAVAVFVVAVATVPQATSADPSIEAQVMAKIRASRPGGLIQHAGLHAVARQHSMYMSNSGRMSHDNADQRITNAPPDPFETNGAPDDGVPPAAWCENVTYSTGHPASEVAQRLYSQWQGSGAHARCMRDTSRNVGAVGVHYDGTTWWATFVATTDKTPPGAPKPQKTSPPAPAPAASDESDTPAATTEPQTNSAPVSENTSPASESTPAGAADASAPVAEEATDEAKAEASAAPERPADLPTLPTGAETFVPEPVAAEMGYGWQELAAVGAVLAIASFIVRRRSRRKVPVVYAPPDVVYAPPEVERRDHVALPEVELVGAGASYSGVERHALASLTLS
jgi:hypothetical protein